LSLSARSYVFDAGVISLFYAGEKGVKPYFDRVYSGRARGFVNEVNLAEFYYKTVEKIGMTTAELRYVQVRRSKIRCVPPNEQSTRRAAVWKVQKRGLSLADCYALATREDKAETLLTTDSLLKDAGGRKVVLIPVP
jgi:predicted nucleic acid-binding protein